MARLAGFLFRNWPLKIAALGLAFVLYTGLVLSQGVRVWPGPVPIQAINQPTGAFLLEPLGNVTEVRFSALNEVAENITPTDFRATVDLRDVKPQPGGAPATVPVHMSATDPRITIIDFRPQQIAVRLDPVITRTVQVVVDPGLIPQGLVVGKPSLSENTVTVRGASSLVERVSEAVARVSIDPNAINVDADVQLVALDDRDQPVQPVDLEPAAVHVQVTVAKQRSTRSVSVVPVFSGSLPPGYETHGVARVSPQIVTVTGDENVLGDVDTITTTPISLDNRKGPFSHQVGFDLPVGVTAVDSAQVQVFVEIRQKRETRSYNLGITLVGARPDRTYRLASNTVLVTFGGFVADLDAVDPARLSATLDVRAIDTGTRAVPVRVEAPSGTRTVSVNPVALAVTVEQAPVPAPSASP